MSPCTMTQYESKADHELKGINDGSHICELLLGRCKHFTEPWVPYAK